MIEATNILTKIRKKIETRLLGAITRVHTTEPVVALTFDDGPDSIDTPKVLDLLEHYGIRATFFVLGIRAVRHPELIERIVQSGHAIGNHSWSHTSMPTLTPSKRRQEIRKTRKVLKPYGSPLFRPPFGHLDWQTYRDVRRCGYRLVTWSAVAEDWLDHSDNQILTSLESKLKPGRIVLLHDSLYSFEHVKYRNREPLLSALDHLFKHLAPYYSFVTLPELLKKGPAMKSYRLNLGDPDWLSKRKKISDIFRADSPLSNQAEV